MTRYLRRGCGGLDRRLHLRARGTRPPAFEAVEGSSGRAMAIGASQPRVSPGCMNRHGVNIFVSASYVGTGCRRAGPPPKAGPAQAAVDSATEAPESGWFLAYSSSLGPTRESARSFQNRAYICVRNQIDRVRLLVVHERLRGQPVPLPISERKVRQSPEELDKDGAGHPKRHEMKTGRVPRPLRCTFKQGQFGVAVHRWRSSADRVDPSPSPRSLAARPFPRPADTISPPRSGPEQIIRHDRSVIRGTSALRVTRPLCVLTSYSRPCRRPGRFTR